MNALKAAILRAKKTRTPLFDPEGRLRVDFDCRTTLDGLPKDETRNYCFKYAFLLDLMWDYAESAVAVCQGMDRENADRDYSDGTRHRRKIGQAIMKLRDDALATRRRMMAGNAIASVREFSEKFDDVEQPRIAMLAHLLTEDARRYGLTERMTTMVVAAGTACTVAQAADLYTRRFAGYLRRYGKRLSDTRLTDSMRRLSSLLQALCGDAWTQHLPDRDMMAKIICNDLVSIKLVEDNGIS